MAPGTPKQGWWANQPTDVPVTTPPAVVPPPTPEDVQELELYTEDEEDILERRIEMTGAELLVLIDEAKELTRASVEAELRAEVDERVKAQYAAKPVYRGVLGFMSRILGKMPDSTGRPSGSWTLYVWSHMPALIYVGCVCYSVLKGVNYKALTIISPWILLFPILLCWIAWLAHHKKVAQVVIDIVQAIGSAVVGAKGGGGLIPTTVTTVTTALDKAPPDPNLKPGKKVELKKKDGSKKKRQRTKSV